VCLLLAALPVTTARALDERCDLSCPIGQRCDAAGHGVGSPEEAAAPVYTSPEGGFPGTAEPTAFRHDGFLARLTLGLGPGYFSERESAPGITTDLEPATATSRIDFSGLALVMALDFGVVLNDSLTAQLRFAELLLPEPERELSGSSQRQGGDGARTALLTAPGLCYFIMPSNVYLALAAGPLLWRGAGYDGDRSLGDFGFGGTFDVGIEWWLGKQWGLGAAGRLFALWATGDAEPRGDRTTSGLSPFVLLSLTYQ
jgi:hypothetical protein